MPMVKAVVVTASVIVVMIAVGRDHGDPWSLARGHHRGGFPIPESDRIHALM